MYYFLSQLFFISMQPFCIHSRLIYIEVLFTI